MTEQNQELTLSEKYAKDLYGMKLGEFIAYDNESSWLRVPDGWVYSNLQGCVFIPWNNEFCPSTEYTTDDIPF